MDGDPVSLSLALLEVSLLLGGAVLVSLLTQRVHIPLTVVLAVAGMLIVELGVPLAVTDLLTGEGFRELLVHLFLPILIFEAALGLFTREFMRNIVAITALATIALLIAAGLVGFGLTLWLGMPLVIALLFGALISATDPAAVVAIFRDVGVPRRLLTLVEGESLLNDGVAIVLYSILLTGATGAALTFGGALAEFAVVVAGGLAVGGVIGTGAVLLLPRLHRLPAAAMSVAVAYGSFVIAEQVQASGVMATVAAGIAIGGLLESRAQQPVRDLLHELWASLAFIANALLFLFIGLALDLDLIRENITAIGIAIGAVLVARPLAVVPVVGLLERWAHIPKVGQRNSAVVVWGGLRGGVALALALALPAELGQWRDTLIAMTAGVVLATLLLNATTIQFLVHALGLDRPSNAENYLGALARLLAVRAARERLTKLGFQDDLVEAHLHVAEADAQDQLDRSRLTDKEEVEVLTLRGLHIERGAYQSLSDAGLLPPIATRTLMQEIDDEIEEVELGELRVDAARRAHLPWYGRLHRRVLGMLPQPLGEDLIDVAYIEVSARRLAARKAAEELESFKSLPHVNVDRVNEARKTFIHWEESAAVRLDGLHGSQVDERVLHRRQAKALSRIAAVDVLQELVNVGVLSESIAEQAGARVASEVDQAGT